MASRFYPRIAYIGTESLSLSHGTGMMFTRHFSRYPRTKVVDICYQQHAAATVFQTLEIEKYAVGFPEWYTNWANAANDALESGRPAPGLSLIYQQFVFSRAAIDWKKYGGPPDLIYSTCYTAESFALLHHVYRHLPKKVPILQHFLDLETHDFSTFLDLWKKLEPHVKAVWALTEDTRQKVATFTRHPIELVHAFHQSMTSRTKENHREFGAGFRSILVGNIWNRTAFDSLAQIWGAARAQNKHVGKIDWYGHARRFHQLGLEPRKSHPIYRDLGFVNSEALRKCLRAADIALVPFTGKSVSGQGEDYARYSLPSRIGDYCAAGLPIVAISRPGTGLANFVLDHRIGLVLDPTKEVWASNLLLTFLMDKRKRQECGRNARALAEREFNLERYQTRLYRTLQKISGVKTPASQDQTHAKPHPAKASAPARQSPSGKAQGFEQTAPVA